MLKVSQVDVIAEELVIQHHKLFEQSHSSLELTLDHFACSVTEQNINTSSNFEVEGKLTGTRIHSNLFERQQCVEGLWLKFKKMFTKDSTDSVVLKVPDLLAKRLSDRSQQSSQRSTFFDHFIYWQ